MNSVDTLQFQNVRGGSGRVEARGRNVYVCGRNHSGKSRYLSAVRFLATGSEPEMGGRRDAAMLSQGGQRLEVAITSTHGDTVSRQHGGRSSGADDIASLFGDPTTAEQHLAIHRRLLRAEPKDRSAAIQSLLESGAMSPAEMGELADALCVLRLAEFDPQDPDSKAIATLASAMSATLGDSAAKVLEVIREEVDWADELEGGTHSALTMLRSRARAAQDARSQAQNRRSELEMELVRSGIVDARKVDDVRSELEKIQADVTRADERLNGLREQAEADRDRAQKVASAQADATAAKSRLQEATDQLDECYRLRSEAHSVSLPEEPAAPRAPKQTSCADDLSAARDRLKADDERRGWRKKLDDTNAAIEALQVPELPGDPQPELDRARQELASLESAANAEHVGWPAVLEVADDLDDSGLEDFGTRLRDAANEAGVQPVPSEEQLAVARQAVADAEACVRKWFATKGRIAAAEGRLEELESDRAIAEGVLAKSEDALTDEQRDKVACEIADLEAQVEKERESLEQHEAAEKAHRAARRKWSLQCSRLRQERDEMLEEASAIERAFHEAKGASDSAAAKLEGLLSASPKDLSGDIASAEADLNRLVGERDRVSPQIRAAEEAARIREEMKDLEKQASDADIRAKGLQAAAWACQKLQAIELERSGGGLTDLMFEWLQAAGMRHRPFARIEKGDVAFGWTSAETGADIPVRSLWGSDLAFFCAALSTACQVLRQTPLALSLVEAAEMEPETLADFCRGADFALENWGVQTILATWVEPSREVDGKWAVVNCDARTREVAHAV